MSAHTLTERYVAAAMRTVPDDQRDDLAAELRTSIDDQIDARVDGGEPRERAEREVLTALGDPDKLAAGYTGRPLQLIGPQYFLDWKRLVTVLLWIVVPLAALGIALGQTLSGAGVGAIIGSAVGGAITVAVHLVFWTTFVFALVERYQRPAGPLTTWTVDHLPEPRQSGTGVGEVIGGVVALLAATAALMWDHFVGFVPGIPVSFVAPELWPAGVTYALIVLALDALLLLVVHVVRRWTIPLAAIAIVLNLALAVPALWLLATGQLVNPEFFPTIIPSGGEQVGRIVTIVAGFVIAGTCVWDIIDTVRKTVAARRG
ncbi:permease prefix domain 1-containing protein [Microbacterium awajiense]|uniref:Permease prefix domain 1-containing protein n=1 Tax=Microbacterium awajiense TaxID=415214 RepID=A0ABP7AX34_9MICO